MKDNHEFYMRKALTQAHLALTEDEVPVGAIMIHNDKVIAKSYNQCRKLCDPTAHAEMQIITSACHYLNSRYLDQCVLYTTLEPCYMCSGALFWAQLGVLVYGAGDPKQGFSNINKKITHPKTNIIRGVLQQECAYLLSDFFEKKRKLKKK